MALYKFRIIIIIIIIIIPVMSINLFFILNKLFGLQFCKSAVLHKCCE